MNIIKAQSADLIEVFHLLKGCVKEMNSRGWISSNWDFDLVRKDVENGLLFLFKTDYHSLGMISFATKISDEYNDVSWENSSDKALLISRIFVHATWRKHGITDKLMAFAEEYAKERGYTSLRLDVYSENEDAITFFNRLQYHQSGQIHKKIQKVPFFCFEKKI